MVAHGEGSQLYDLRAQAEAQNRYFDAGRKVKEPDFPFMYPAAVTLIFAPLTLLPPSPAFAVWTLVNLALLLACLRILQLLLPLPQNNSPLLGAVCFAPTYVVLLNGQVTIVVLFLFTLAFYFLTREHQLIAGLMFGLAFLKFQVVLGILAVMILRRMWRVLAGAAIGGALVALSSMCIVGWRAAIHYPVYLQQIAYCSVCQKTPISIAIPGVLWQITRHEPRVWIVGLISLGLVAIAAFAWRDLKTGFSMALIVSLLVAFHSHITELSLLLLPFAILSSRTKNKDVVVLGMALLVILGYVSIMAQLETVYALVCYVVIATGLALPRHFGLRSTVPLAS